MPDPWSPQEVRQLLATTTGCLCLVIVVVGTMLGVNNGAISADVLGSAKAVGVGGGVIGLSSIVYLVIRAGLHGEKKRGRR